MGEVVGMCAACVPEGFGGGEEKKIEGQEGGEGEVHRPVGGDAVLAESIEAAGRKKEVPVVKAFERLTLLGASI
jgi:elongator complex protein 1